MLTLLYIADPLCSWCYGFRAGDRYGIVTRGYAGFERMKASVERFREMVRG